MPRQRRIARPKAPRMAPTAMKTVPSGRVEWFMKGALWVGGIVGAGYSGIAESTVLERVGMPVASLGGPAVVLELRPGILTLDVEDEDEDDVVRAVVVVDVCFCGSGLVVVTWRAVVVVLVCWVVVAPLPVVVVGGAAWVDEVESSGLSPPF